MQDSEYLYDFALEKEVDGIRKPTHQDAAHFPMYLAVGDRCLRCPFYRRIELQK